VSATVVDLRAASSLHPAVLALNGRHEIETAPLDASGLATRLDRACAAPAILDAAGRLAGFLLAYAAESGLDAVNFRWVCDHLSGFVYIDRIIIDPAMRGSGLGRRLYAEAEAAARRRGAQWLACEVNAEPPNPVSDAFHARLGFTVFGEGRPAPGKTVRYLRRALP
jgi:predicted GNAT superfamily acetyltransferase